MDKCGREVPPSKAEIHSSLTVGKYYQVCGFKIGRWNGEAVKLLSVVGDRVSADRVFNKIKTGKFNPKCSLKSLSYEAKVRFCKGA